MSALRVLVIVLALWGALSASFVAMVLVNRQPGFEERVAAQMAQDAETIREREATIAELRAGAAKGAP
jgi:hypothetical protein